MRYVDLCNNVINTQVRRKKLPLATETIEGYVRSHKWVDNVRVGRYGREFRVYKIRTLPLEASVVHKTWYDTIEHDPSSQSQISFWGRLLRRFLDEIPQTKVNIPLGEMTWAGPRPLIKENDLYLPEILQYARRYFVPGLANVWCAADLPLDVEETSAEVREQGEWAFMLLALKESLREKDYSTWHDSVKNEDGFPMQTNYKQIFIDEHYLQALEEAGQNGWPMPSDYPKTEELFFRKAVWNKLTGKNKSK